ncbi:GDSL-like Lipase/Acylhydrolase [Aureliella helgolandensis]|uniref:GDSL-like Lipase/Acylhydrolase n=2 Tax=Aureliella helgolandensis TaxID=2527968 RepID=A0A518G6E0_9BACT|nr:GDSL-like Lipase/Acylhydrolase [Aureliella helgolandensis]
MLNPLANKHSDDLGQEKRHRPKSARIPAHRLWLFRIGAILVGLLPLAACEGVLRWIDLPRHPPATDPFVDLHSLKPLFELNPETDILSIGAQRMNLFRPASFARVKGQGGFRVFALGGSTTQGEPYSTETAFPQWLELNLQAAMPDRRVEVINCGGLSYASYRVLAILQEVLEYSPDLIVIYTGQNEYLERRSYEGLEDYQLLHLTRYRLSQLRLVQLFRSWITGPAEREEIVVRQPTRMQTEVDALLDYQGGLEEYQRGDTWHDTVPLHFRWNLEQMVAGCQRAQVPLVLVAPVTNLLDCPPFKFAFAPHQSPQQRAQFSEYWEQATQNTGEAENQASAGQALASALEIDPHHAGALFLLGRRQYASGDYAPAKRTLQAARDADVCPLRAPTAISAVIREVAQNADLPLVDADRLFSDASEHGIVGDQWLVDHIHPSLEGHQLLAEAIAEKCVQEGLIQPGNLQWREDRAESYANQLRGLSEAYFHRGKQRLEGLLLWTQGRAKKTRSE